VSEDVIGGLTTENTELQTTNDQLEAEIQELHAEIELVIQEEAAKYDGGKVREDDCH
jgi:cell division protein FtsB